MNLGLQIKKYRNELSMSQDELAEKVYVSRQSISNWENDKTYPDIKSLILLSEVFDVSLDKLIKGDIEEMRKDIDNQEKAEFQRYSNIFAVLLICTVLVPMPLAKFFGWVGLALYMVLIGIMLYYAIRVEKMKKIFNIQTYKEIAAFIDGTSLDEIEKARESGKRAYQKIFLAISSGIIAFVVCALMKFLLF